MSGRMMASYDRKKIRQSAMALQVLGIIAFVLTPIVYVGVAVNAEEKLGTAMAMLIGAFWGGAILMSGLLLRAFAQLLLCLSAIEEHGLKAG